MATTIDIASMAKNREVRKINGQYVEVFPETKAQYVTVDDWQGSAAKLSDVLSSLTNVVHTSGNETISGTKTFTSNPHIEKAGPLLYLNRIYEGETPADVADIRFQNNGTSEAVIRLTLDQNLQLGAKGDGANWYNGPALMLKKDNTFSLRSGYGGTTYALVGSADGNLTWKSKAIAIDENVVHLTGDEIISGVKTFTGDVKCTAGALFREYHASYVQGNSYSSNVYLANSYLDKNGSSLADILYFLNTPANNGDACLEFRVFGNPNHSSSVTATLGVHSTASGEIYAHCPTPSSTTDNSTKIATTAWIRTATGNTTLNAANVTGTVAIANGGTGATSRLGALKALTNESVSTNATHFLTITTNWAKGGYTSVADVKTVLGLKSAAYTESSSYVQTSGDQTITGVKTFNNLVITGAGNLRRTADSSELWLCGGTGNTAANGAYIGLYGATNSGSYPGFFNITTGKVNNKSAQLLGNPDGTLTWGGKEFVYTSGAQTIDDKKTFAKNAYYNLCQVFKFAFAHGTNPSAWAHRSIYFSDNTGGEQTADLIGMVRSSIGTNGATRLQISAVQNVNSSPAVATLDVNANADGVIYATCPMIRPATNNAYSCGSPTYKWTQVYAISGTINTSDERLKSSISAVPDAVLDAWGDVQWTQFQFKDAVAEKGIDKARIHNGLIAQRIDEVFTAHGLDASRYGLFCYDAWDAVPEEKDEEGNVVVPATEAGDAYSLRYEEALAMEAAYQRRRADRAEARISTLERRLNEMETVITTLGFSGGNQE